MSQELALDVLESLGGDASTGEIREEAKDAYPDRISLHRNVSARLKQLAKWELVERYEEEGVTRWRISS